MTHLLIGWRAGDLIVIMDGGQHGPPRREVWSYHHPSSKPIRHQSSPIHHDNFEPRLLTRLSRLFQRESLLCAGDKQRAPTRRARVENRPTSDGHQNGYQRVFNGFDWAVAGFAWSTISARTRKYSNTINLGFFFIRPANRPLKVRRNFERTSRQRNVYSTRKAPRFPRAMLSSSLTAWEGCSRTLWYQTRATRFGTRLRPGP